MLKREYTAIARTLALTDNYDKVAELLASLIDPKDETEQEVCVERFSLRFFASGGVVGRGINGLPNSI